MTEIKEQIPIEEEDTEINENQEEPKEIYYNIEKYDKLIGYMEGTSGLRQINDKDYVFYGDNPDNYIYYNCKNDNISSCELWRIVGLYYDEINENYNMKIVRNESIGKYQFDNTEEPSDLTWTNSTLYKYLNKEYQFEGNYNNFTVERIPNKEILLSLDTEIKTTKIEKEDILLSMNKEQQNEETENEEENINIEENENNEKDLELKLNILSLQDYLNTSSCKKNKINQYSKECFANNWLNNIEIDREWTLTEQEPKEMPVEESTTETEELLEDEENFDKQVTTEDNTNEDNIVDETTTEEEPTEEENIEPIKTIIINSAYGIKEDITETNVKEFLDFRPVIYIK